MSILKSLAFGSALLVASFTASAPAQADSVGVYIHSGGIGVQVSDYGHARGRYYNPCNDFYYRQSHRYCWNDGRYAYNNGYGNNGYGYRPHYERHDDWRFNDNRRHERWERRRDRREGWREDRRDRRDGDRGRWNGGEHHHH